VIGGGPHWWTRFVLIGCRLAFVPGIILAAAALGHPALASTADDTKALVERAVAHIHAVGQWQAFADITRRDGGFVDGELYVFCDDLNGTVLAHGGNPMLVGKSLWNVPDRDGKLRTRELVQLARAQGQGWLNYLWPNPGTGRIQRKVTYVVLVDDLMVCGSGYYKDESP
jgi:signal transduction histidine kinase